MSDLLKKAALEVLEAWRQYRGDATTLSYLTQAMDKLGSPDVWMEFKMSKSKAEAGAAAGHRDSLEWDLRDARKTIRSQAAELKELREAAAPGSQGGPEPDVPRDPILHELKCWPEYFRAILSGAKRFEVRNNDRGFQWGDSLYLREWDPATGQYTGAWTEVYVPYVLKGAMLPPGLVVMTIVPKPVPDLAGKIEAPPAEPTPSPKPDTQTKENP